MSCKPIDVFQESTQILSNILMAIPIPIYGSESRKPSKWNR